MIIPSYEIELIKAGLIQKYDYERKTRNISTARSIRFVKTPEHYSDLADIVTVVLKSLKSPLSSPGNRFFRKIFTESGSTFSCHENNINVCYLFAFGMTRQEYWDPKYRLLKKKFSIRVSNHLDIDAVYKLNTIVNEGLDVIPHTTLLEWHEKNPASIHIITDQFGKIVGNINILPIKDEVIEFFLSGDLISSDFRRGHIFAPSERNKVTYLHIQNIIDIASEEALIECLGNLSLIINRLCSDINNIKKVFCLAASPEIKHIMPILNFIKYKDTQIFRRDGHEEDIYYADIRQILIGVADLFRNNPKYELSYKNILALLGTLKM